MTVASVPRMRRLTLLLVSVCALVGRAGAEAAEPAPFVLPQPYFDGDGARGIELMGLERWADARAAFAAFAAGPKAPKDDVNRARLAYVTALCDRHLANWADAAAGFDVAAAGLPLLGDYAHYEAAAAYYHLLKLDEAQAHLVKIAPDA